MQLDTSNYVAMLWVNGVPQRLSDGSSFAQANSVFVLDGNVYVAGYERDAQTPNYVAMLWVNGVPQRLSDGSNLAEANSVFVSDGNVYVAGYEDAQTSNYVAMLWVNGVPQHLSDGSSLARAYSIFVDTVKDNVPVTGVSLNKSSTTLRVGSTEMLAATVLPSNATNKAVTWISNNTSVAAIYSSGLVTAMAAGTATITVTTQDGLYTASCNVVVSGSGAPDVYVAGVALTNTTFNGTVWKNGIAQSLSGTPVMANSVFVSGDDVYVAGVDSTYAAVWKNGVAQRLSVPSDAMMSYALSVFISGNDVYVAGYIMSTSGQTATLWKNNVAQHLSSSRGSTANSVFVSGNDVYVAGTDNYANVVWKNGVIFLSNVGGDSVFVAGNDVYSASKTLGAYKNGMQLYLDHTGFSSILQMSHSIYVSDGDVYVAGYVTDNNNSYHVALWKNGALQVLSGPNATPGNAGGGAPSVFVYGNDVYVAATEMNGNQSTAKLWKNGVEQVIGSGQAHSVFVKSPA